MKISTRARYAARALAVLASVHPDGTTSVRDIAASQRVSPKYLEQIFNALKTAGLLRAVRGMGGGYALARPPCAITLRDVYEAVDGSVAPVDCVDRRESCWMADVCPTRDTWVEIKQAVSDVLERTTLQDLADRRTQKAAASAAMYHI
jgi:Rrf2 family protein